MVKQKKVDSNEASEIIATRKDVIEIPMGTHEGSITMVEKTVSEDGQFEYLSIKVLLTDIDYKEDQDPVTLRMGFPLNLSVKSGLGRLMALSGFDITKQKDYTMKDFMDCFIGRKIRFLTDNQKTDKGEFANIIRDSIKFIK